MHGTSTQPQNSILNPTRYKIAMPRCGEGQRSKQTYRMQHIQLYMNTSIVSEIGAPHTGQRPAAGGRGIRAHAATSALAHAPHTHAWRHGSSTQLRGASRQITHIRADPSLSLLSLSSSLDVAQPSGCGCEASCG